MQNQPILNQKLEAQQQELMAIQELAHHQTQQINYPASEVQQRPRFRSFARRGMFEGKTQETDDVNIESNPRDYPLKGTQNTLVTTGGDMPRSPIYKGATQSHKRAFMNAYLACERTVQV